MHTLSTVSKWDKDTHGRKDTKYWIGLHLAVKESLNALILVLICPETFVSKYFDSQNGIK